MLFDAPLPIRQTGRQHSTAQRRNTRSTRSPATTARLLAVRPRHRQDPAPDLSQSRNYRTAQQMRKHRHRGPEIPPPLSEPSLPVAASSIHSTYIQTIPSNTLTLPYIPTHRPTHTQPNPDQKKTPHASRTPESKPKNPTDRPTYLPCRPPNRNRTHPMPAHVKSNKSQLPAQPAGSAPDRAGSGARAGAGWAIPLRMNPVGQAVAHDARMSSGNRGRDLPAGSRGCAAPMAPWADLVSAEGR